jgi:uncharacterized protein (UPF0248 family)
MVPIESLLHRIRWDEEFGAAEFTIGYYDRARRAVVTLPFERIHLEPSHHFSFTASGPDGSVHQVPFHRVREVHRNGELIWQREAKTGLPSKRHAERAPE